MPWHTCVCDHLPAVRFLNLHFAMCVIDVCVSNIAQLTQTGHCTISYSVAKIFLTFWTFPVVHSVTSVTSFEDNLTFTTSDDVFHFLQEDTGFWSFFLPSFIGKVITNGQVIQPCYQRSSSRTSNTGPSELLVISLPGEYKLAALVLDEESRVSDLSGKSYVTLRYKTA